MNQNSITWVSLWEPLLEEAVQAALVAATSPQRETASAAAAIVLARSSWEAFSNELIEQRALTPKLKNANSLDKIKCMFEQLGQPSASWRDTIVWQDFFLANDIRNVVVHQKNVTRLVTQSSTRITRGLEDRRVISASDASSDGWEARVLRRNVATWCLRTFSAAIAALEEVPNRQFRTPDIVRVRLREILMPIEEPVGGGR